MKICRNCVKEQPLDCFSKHPKMKDGYLNKCKGCHAEYSRQHRKDNQARYRIYDKNRAYSKERIQSQAVSSKLSKTKYALRYKARAAVNNSLRNGSLIRFPCFICGDSKSEAHHPDYSRPLEVVWLCTKHHMEIHHEYTY